MPPGALVRPKDPLEYLRKLRFHQTSQGVSDYGVIDAVTIAVCRTSSIHTDGACSGNPGPAAGARSCSFGGHEKELKGGEADTTNNRMELMAAIAALEALKRPCRVDLHTDSQYLRNGITQWIGDWKRNGWRTADKKPVKNVDLWQRLDAAVGAPQGALALGARPCRSRVSTSAPTSSRAKRSRTSAPAASPADLSAMRVAKSICRSSLIWMPIR